MEFKKPKPKKNFPLKRKIIPCLKNNKKITAVFNGQFVTVSDWESMNYLHEMGVFGKGTLSKGEPNYNNKSDDIPKTIFQHQYENHSKWISRATNPCRQKNLRISRDFELSLQTINELLQSSFTDSERSSWKSWKDKNSQRFVDPNKKNETTQTDLSLLEFKLDNDTYKDTHFVELVNEILEAKKLKKPKMENSKTNEVVVIGTSFNSNNSNLSLTDISSRLETLYNLGEENLNLNLEESFFLNCQLKCLKIVDLNLKELELPELWEKFNVIDKNFTQRYVTYCYYKAKGWVIKSGLKFGGDFLLYKDGPVYYHSSYLLKVLDRRKKMTWREFVMMNRLVETYNKDLILCNVVPKTTPEEKQSFPEVCANNTVQEILVQRWFPSKERFFKEDKTT